MPTLVLAIYKFKVLLETDTDNGRGEEVK